MISKLHIKRKIKIYIIFLLITIYSLGNEISKFEIKGEQESLLTSIHLEKNEKVLIDNTGKFTIEVEHDSLNWWNHTK